MLLCLTQVLRGGDRLIDFMFKDPQLNVLILHKDEVDGRVERVADIEGNTYCRYFFVCKHIFSFFYLSSGFCNSN